MFLLFNIFVGVLLTDFRWLQFTFSPDFASNGSLNSGHGSLMWLIFPTGVLQKLSNHFLGSLNLF